MKRQTKIILSTIFIVLIIFIILNWFYFFILIEAFRNSFDPNTYPRISFDEELNIIENASLTGNINLCYKLPQERKEPLTYRSPRADCFREVAISTKNISLCFSKEVIGFGGFGPDGNNDCFREIAVNTENLSLCLETKNRFPYLDNSEAQECIISIASLKKNDSICNLYGNTTDDHLLCRMYFEDSNSSLCLNATTSWFKERCKQYFGIE